jgi:hypothetical protein
MVLGFELGTFCLLIRCSTTGPHLQPFCFSYCLNGVSCFCQGLASDHNPSSSTSHVAATAGMHHHVQPLSSLKYIIHIFFHVFFRSDILFWQFFILYTKNLVLLLSCSLFFQRKSAICTVLLFPWMWQVISLWVCQTVFFVFISRTVMMLVALDFFELSSWRFSFFKTFVSFNKFRKFSDIII